MRRFLVSGQIAVSVILLVSAGLFITTLANLQRVDPGFKSANLLRMDFLLPASRYPRDMSVWPDWSEVNGFSHQLISGVQALPGVESATITLNHPLDRGFTNSFSINEQPVDRDQGEMTTRMVTPGYFETVGVGLVAGRQMDATDETDTPFVVVINQAAADRYFPGGDAIGSTLSFWGPWTRESLLFGVEPFDLKAYAVVTVLLGSVALLASALPARRASRIDPMTSLRSE